MGNLLRGGRHVLLAASLVVLAPGALAQAGGPSGNLSLNSQLSSMLNASTSQEIDRQRRLSISQIQSLAREMARTRSRDRSLNRERPLHVALIFSLLHKDLDPRIDRCAQVVSRAHHAWPREVAGWGDSAAMAKWARERTRCALAISQIGYHIGQNLGPVEPDRVHKRVESIVRGMDIDAVFSKARREVKGYQISIDMHSGGSPSWKMGPFRGGYGEDAILTLSKGGVEWYGNGNFRGTKVYLSLARNKSQSKTRSKENTNQTEGSMDRSKSNEQDLAVRAETRNQTSTGVNAQTP